MHENLDSLNAVDILADAHTKNKLHDAPIKIKVKPSIKKGTALSALLVTNWGRRAKKKSATFGLSRFVKSPCLNTAKNDNEDFSALILILDFDFNAIIPRYIKYAAPAIFTILNKSAEVISITERPSAAKAVWTNKPHTIPATEANPCLYPPAIDFVKIKTVSAPGVKESIITASINP